jgi:hypothetical protein
LKGVKVHGPYREFFTTFAVSLVSIFFFRRFLLVPGDLGSTRSGERGADGWVVVFFCVRSERSDVPAGSSASWLVVLAEFDELVDEAELAEGAGSGELVGETGLVGVEGLSERADSFDMVSLGSET